MFLNNFNMDDDEKKPLLMRKTYTTYRSVMKNEYDGTSPLQVERPIYQIEDLNRDTLYEKPNRTLRSRCRKTCSSIHPVAVIKKTVPILSWLPEYSWRKSFFNDIISGITVAIMHIPQGMAYGLLGGVPPVVGIYMAFFPVLVYFIFGTSRHVSMGTFAIVCLMTGKVVSQYTTIEITQDGTLKPVMAEWNRTSSDTFPQYTNVEVAMTVTFTVAMIQLAMYVLRLGMVSDLLSETLVNGFTCASAFHVVSSQLKDLLGLHIKKRRGNFSFLYTIYDSILAIPGANLKAMMISFIAMVILVANNELFKPWLSKKTRIPFPIELVAVVIGTTVSYFGNLNAKYNISVVGHIPTGLPEPALPAFELIPHIFLDSFVITMVSYTVTMSMALIFARKLMYEVDSNQELLALGVSNTVGSFFSCIPITASLSRSMIQQAVGGVTQIASVVSCCILLVILLWIGPVFETLPRCVLASIIVVALKGMLVQCTAVLKYWRLSKWDAVVWFITFATTLFVQISYGLAAGVAVSLLSVFIQGYKPYTCLLGIVPNTDLYLDIKRYKGAQEIEGLKIFHYSGGLSFASRNSFKDLLIRKTGLDAAAVLRKRVKLTDKGLEDEDELLTKCIILDFSCLTFVDPAGVDFLRTMQSDYAKLGVSMYIAGCSGPVYEVIMRCDKVEKKENKFFLFPTVHDAVLFAQASVLSKKDS
ncbi:solute carrier family 26 member 10 isoform X2 [Anoplophora glabripennis]|uniref:solute carrier family 26 member 10 isoform X2 n=1 Tax=Anoplophora glabripennis TaxID=217634 RepID=UPI0008750B48|nr:solute carrier family 26 member 10 isoform X2 [Anoplophora glabripennis]